MKKFGATTGPRINDDFYEGGEHKAQTKTETKLLKHVKKKDMKKKKAQKVMDELNSNRRFSSRTEFCIAALVRLFPGELGRKVAGTKMTVHKLLVRTVQPSRAEWLLNHQRQRQALSRAEAKQAAFGTASNEALHAELNRWFRTIVQMHQPTLRTKLFTFQLFKLLTHNSAVYHATTCQVSQALLASRVVSATEPWRSDEEWQEFCATQPEPRTQRAILTKKLKTWRQKHAKEQKRGSMKAGSRTSVFRAYKGIRLWWRARAGKAMKA